MSRGVTLSTVLACLPLIRSTPRRLSSRNLGIAERRASAAVLSLGGTRIPSSTHPHPSPPDRSWCRPAAEDTGPAHDPRRHRRRRHGEYRANVIYYLTA